MSQLKSTRLRTFFLFCIAGYVLLFTVSSWSPASPELIIEDAAIPPRGGRDAREKQVIHVENNTDSHVARHALLALYGVQNRDHGCAWASHQRVREALESMGYQVDVLVYEMRPDAANKLDKVPWHFGSLRHRGIQFYRSDSLSQVDKKKTSALVEHIISFAPRQLSAEMTLAHVIPTSVMSTQASNFHCGRFMQKNAWVTS